MNGQSPTQRQASPSPGHAPSPYPEQSQAVVVLILGVLGVFVLPLLAPFAWTIGNRELDGIDAGRRAPDNRQMARIGQVFGIIISILLILFVALILALVVGVAVVQAVRG